MKIIFFVLSFMKYETLDVSEVILISYLFVDIFYTFVYPQ